MHGYTIYWPSRWVVYATKAKAEKALKVLSETYRNFEGKICRIIGEEVSVVEGDKLVSDRDFGALIGEGLLQLISTPYAIIEITKETASDDCGFRVTLNNNKHSESGGGVRLSDAIAMAMARLVEAEKEKPIIEAVEAVTFDKIEKKNINIKGLSLKK